MDMGVLKKMVVSFLKTKIKELEEAVKTSDYDKIKAVAHNVKGNSGTMALGWEKCNEIGKKLEQIALAKGNMAEITASIEKLRIEYNKVK